MKITPFHKSHEEICAKMGEFAGYAMPLYYKQGAIKEHEWVRSSAGLFDVSHMGQIIIKGKNSAEFLEYITPSTFTTLPEHTAKYTVLTNDEGGIIDDLIITRIKDDCFFAVINAGCKEKDIAWINSKLPDDVTLEVLDDRALIALQGPKAEAVLKEVMNIDTSDLGYMKLMKTQPGNTYISRVGYTGEDGFELSIDKQDALDIWNALLGHNDVMAIGLVARDSLRLEMGYCLYGHDIDAKTSPVEAGMSWLIGKNNKSFIGAEHILKEKEKGPARKRVAIKLTEKGIARENAIIFGADNKEIGKITSGNFSPALKESIGQGYVLAAYSALDTEISIEVRGRRIAAKISRMPFVKARTKSAKQA